MERSLVDSRNDDVFLQFVFFILLGMGNIDIIKFMKILLLRDVRKRITSIDIVSNGFRCFDHHDQRGVSPRNLPAAQRYQFSFIATQKYELILYLDTRKRT